jgi:hypothetical protein
MRQKNQNELNLGTGAEGEGMRGRAREIIEEFPTTELVKATFLDPSGPMEKAHNFSTMECQRTIIRSLLFGASDAEPACARAAGLRRPRARCAGARARARGKSVKNSDRGAF